MAERRLILGTAGHIDHGKTALVTALTGTNTDRLSEERRRGLSIELGFAELRLPSGSSMGVVDVPGHERLIRTMAAGASGFDLFLLVIAADEGVMPQTREHVQVLDALGVDEGLVALTKIDRAGGESRSLARDEASALVPGRRIVEVSGVTGEGLNELLEALEGLAAELQSRAGAESPPQGPPVLHVDRVFTLHGVGTVATGTLWGGALHTGERVEILPSGGEARIRSLQVHNRQVAGALAGQRVAVALTGIRRDEVERGDTITYPRAGLVASYRLDVELRLVPDVGSLAGERVQLHHGTRAVPARVVDLGGGLAQLRLESPLVARAGDRLLIRRPAPPTTVGGGVVLDPAPPRHGPGAATERLRRIRELGIEAVEAREREERAATPRPPEPKAAAELEKRDLVALGLLRRDGIEPRSPVAVAERLGVSPKEATASLDRLVAAGHAVRLSREVYYASDRLEEARSRALALARSRGRLSLPELRDALGTSRKYAQALLEHLDASKITVRQGDSHVLRRSG